MNAWVSLSSRTAYGADHEQASPAIRFIANEQISPCFNTKDLSALANLEQHRNAVRGLSQVERNVTGATFANVRGRLSRTWRMALSMRTVSAYAAASRTERFIQDLAESEATALRAELNLLRATALALNDDAVRALPMALAGLRLEEAKESAVAATLCRVSAWRQGDLAGFYALGRSAALPAENERHVSAAVIDRTLEAAVEAQQLRFSAARRLAEDALDLADGVSTASPVAMMPVTLLAELAYEEGRVDLAWDLLEPRLPQLRRRPALESAVRAYALLARIAAGRGDHRFAVLLLKTGETIGVKRDWTRLTAACLHSRFELLFQEGREAEAQACLGELRQLAASRPYGEGQFDAADYATLAAARFQSRDGEAGAAIAAIRQLQGKVLARSDLYGGLRLSIRLIETLLAANDEREAKTLLCHVLTLSAQSGLYQTLLDAGPSVIALLNSLYHQMHSEAALRPLQGYVGHLLIKANAPKARLDSDQRSSGPLSERECVILRLFGRGYSNKEIALELGIAFETVKSHAKNIYAKLNAGNRAAAVARAERLGFI